MDKKNFYITTTLPYVNSEAHLGHALEFVRADVVARYKKLQGFEVFFNTGTDEHGIKIFNKAKEVGVTPQAYVDDYAKRFKDLLPKLGIMEDINFIRTTDPDHIKSAQTFWQQCMANGFIEKKKYSIKYCVGCELEKTNSELVNDCCPEHPNMELENIDEENYFFKFSDFQEKLLKLYSDNPDFVIPSFRFNEIKAFVSRGLSDFSISRLKTKMPWGIEVPGDPDQVMYVWFDALVNYVAAIGWPEDMEKFNKWWPVTQYCGKDNLRQQSAMWQAMLMSVNLPPSKQIIINGFVTAEGGVKMSKSLGNVISPLDVIRDYGTETLRYFVLREIHPFEDTPFTAEGLKNAYNANLANGLGNLTSRVLKMAESYNVSLPANEVAEILSEDLPTEYTESFAGFKLNMAMDYVWSLIKNSDTYIQREQPFKKIKIDKAAAELDVKNLLVELVKIGRLLEPLLPETAKKVIEAVKEGKALATPLFMRKE
ncbi:MAG: methionine--tRNA ligase [Minisyncoccia bacterium]